MPPKQSLITASGTGFTVPETTADDRQSAYAKKFELSSSINDTLRRMQYDWEHYSPEMTAKAKKEFETAKQRLVNVNQRKS